MADAVESWDAADPDLSQLTIKDNAQHSETSRCHTANILFCHAFVCPLTARKFSLSKCGGRRHPIRPGVVTRAARVPQSAPALLTATSGASVLIGALPTTQAEWSWLGQLIWASALP